MIERRGVTTSGVTTAPRPRAAPAAARTGDAEMLEEVMNGHMQGHHASLSATVS